MIKSSFRHSAIALVLSAGAVISAPAVQAQTSQPVVCPGYEKGKTTLVSERTGKKVQKAFEAYSEDRVDEALQLLYDINASDDFDKAYVARFIGNLLAGQDGQGTKALGYLTQAVDNKVLNDLNHADTLKLTADLSMQEKKYNDAIGYYQKWMDFTCKEDPDVYTRMTSAYYSAKQLDKMIDPANKAIALYEEPKKNPYVLKLQSYFERKMYKETIEVAEELVTVFPSEGEWWVRLGFFYMLVEDYAKALSIFEIAYDQGFLKKENEIKTLSQLYATNGIPFKSAKLYEKYVNEGLIAKDAKNYSALANTFHQSKDYKSAAKYYQKAAELSSDPEHYRKQGVLLLVAEDYKGAIKALTAAIDRGAEDQAKIHFSLMEANFYLGDFKKAFYHVGQAKKDKALRRNAVAWEPYIKEKAKNRGINI